MNITNEIQEIVKDSKIGSVEIGTEFSQEKYEETKRDLILKILNHYIDEFNNIYGTNLKITRCVVDGIK